MCPEYVHSCNVAHECFARRGGVATISAAAAIVNRRPLAIAAFSDCAMRPPSNTSRTSLVRPRGQGGGVTQVVNSLIAAIADVWAGRPGDMRMRSIVDAVDAAASAALAGTPSGT